MKENVGEWTKVIPEEWPCRRWIVLRGSSKPVIARAEKIMGRWKIIVAGRGRYNASDVLVYGPCAKAPEGYLEAMESSS